MLFSHSSSVALADLVKHSEKISSTFKMDFFTVNYAEKLNFSLLLKVLPGS